MNKSLLLPSFQSNIRYALMLVALFLIPRRVLFAFVGTTTLIFPSSPLFIVLEFLRVISSFVSDRLWILVDIEFEILISRTYITLKSRWAVIIQLTADLVLLD